MQNDSSPKAQTTALRVAVALFFFVCVPLSIWESRVHAKIFVAQDPVATANQLLQNEFVFRTTLILHLIGTMVFIILTWLFYRVLRPVNQPLAMLMIIPVLLQFPIVFIMEAVNFTALMTLKSDPRQSFTVMQQQEAAYFMMRLYRHTLGADKIVFGFSFIPLGILFFQSGFVPRIVGILVFLGGVGYVLDTTLYFLLQRTDYATIQTMKLFASATYSLGFLYLLIKGARHQTTATTAASA